MPLDTIEFRSPITEIDRKQVFDPTVPKISLPFSPVWQRRFKNLWDFLSPMNDIGNVVPYAGLPQPLSVNPKSNRTPQIGQRAWISDSNTNAWGAVAAGGGANRVGVVWNGVAWTVFAK